MIDDAVMRRINANLEQIKADVRLLERDNDLISLFRSGAFLTLGWAADICQCCAEKIRACERSAATDHPLDSSLRDVKQDDSNNEVAPSRGGEQIDDVLDGLVGAVVGGFESAVRAILRVRTAVEAAVGKGSAQPFVEEQK
jgi:hypothetical protein